MTPRVIDKHATKVARARHAEGVKRLNDAFAPRGNLALMIGFGGVQTGRWVPVRLRARVPRARFDEWGDPQRRQRRLARKRARLARRNRRG